jgi:hypothetical protein
MDSGPRVERAADDPGASAGLRVKFPVYGNATLDLGAYDPASLTFF